jgi:hypothetical protein
LACGSAERGEAARAPGSVGMRRRSGRGGGAIVPSMPWIRIPTFAQPGQTSAFADREDLVASLYRDVVSAGNAMIAGSIGVHQRHAVYGYKGVGKSAVILQVLALLRGEVALPASPAFAPGHTPEPNEPHRWIVIRVSGKQVGAVEHIADAIRMSVLEATGEISRGAVAAAPGALKLPLLHRLLGKDAALFGQVRSALARLAATVEFVRAWQGAIKTETAESRASTVQGGDVKLQLVARLKSMGVAATGRDAEAALDFAAGFLSRWSTEASSATSLERVSVVGADLVVEVLNEFFRATELAKLPTILVLDDFDEFASNAGPSHDERKKVIQQVLGVFGRLAPTSFVLALREEYMHEDIERQWQPIFVPPLSKPETRQVIRAWAAVQQPPLVPAEVTQLVELGDKLLSGFTEEAPVVVPFHFLELLVAIFNQAAPAATISSQIDRYLMSRFPGETHRALRGLVGRMPHDDIERVAEAVAIDPSPYAMQPQERQALERAGLVRSAMAGDPTDTRIVISPIAAYLAMAQQAERGR